MAFTKDWRYAFVQNALLNLPGMSDGSITIVDLKEQKVIGSVDTLKNKGTTRTASCCCQSGTTWRDIERVIRRKRRVVRHDARSAANRRLEP